MKYLNRLCGRYLLWSIGLMSVVSAIVYAVAIMGEFQGLLLPALVSVIFLLVFNVLEIFIWRKVAYKAPEQLTTFYTAVSGFRMLLALGLLFVYYITLSDKFGMKNFVVVFLAYYFVMLGMHSIFFSYVSNGGDKLNKL